MPTTIIDELGNTVVEVLMPAVAGATGATGPTGATGATGSGGEPGGLTGQVLTKASNADYDYVWEYKYSGRFATEAATNRALADATGVTVERYFTCTAEGNGESFNIQSNTPSAGNKIVRKIWYKNEAFEATDVNTWTLLHTFADDTAYASTETQWDAYLEGQTYGKPPFTLALSWEDVPAFTGLLDTYSGAAAAYSVRLLDSTYTGDCIRVRRASDNTEQDIGFDANGDLDTTALASFCAGTNGFVKTWYDQSGNANDATQTATGSQPKIYDSASGVVLENGKPAVDFNGDFLRITGTGQLNLTETLSLFSIHKPNVLNLTTVISKWYNSPNTIRPYIFIYVNNALRYALNGNSVRNDIPTDISQKLMSFLFNKSTQNVFSINGSATTFSYTSSLTASESVDIAIGAEAANLPMNYFVGTQQEIVLYPSAEYANRAAIETNINNAFTIYGQTPTGLLADYPGAAAAYSVRQLISTARYAMAVRRASDNAVLPIGFVNGNLDTATLAAFCSGTNGFVAVWYDQSGNGNHATQTTTANQPKIYDSVTGVLTENGKPAADFDGVNDYLDYVGLTETTLTSFHVAKPNQTNSGDALLGWDGVTGNAFFRYNSDGTMRANFNGGFNTTTNYTVSQNLVFGLFGTSLAIGYNGAIAEIGSATGLTSTGIRIGQKGNVDYFNGKAHEIVVYASNQSTNRAGIESNINSYFSIY